MGAARRGAVRIMAERRRLEDDGGERNKGRCGDSGDELERDRALL